MVGFDNPERIQCVLDYPANGLFVDDPQLTEKFMTEITWIISKMVRSCT